MNEEQFKKAVAEILRKEITFSGQLNDFVIHGALDSIWELHTKQKLNIHGVMQGCQCKDRIGETTVWCCNQCGLPCEEGWLPTHKPFRQPTVGDGAAGQNVSDGHIHYHVHAGSMQKCVLCGEIKDLDCG